MGLVDELDLSGDGMLLLDVLTKYKFREMIGVIFAEGEDIGLYEYSDEKEMYLPSDKGVFRGVEKLSGYGSRVKIEDRDHLVMYGARFGFGRHTEGHAVVGLFVSDDPNYENDRLFLKPKTKLFI